jgi:hypothetical protein
MKTLIKTFAVLGVLVAVTPAAQAEGFDITPPLASSVSGSPFSLTVPQADMLRGQLSRQAPVVEQTDRAYPSREELMIILGDRGRDQG